MSAAKRRIKRKIKMLVRMLETAALVPHRIHCLAEIDLKRWRIFANVQALGKGRFIHQHRDRARAAIEASHRATSVLSKEPK